MTVASADQGRPPNRTASAMGALLEVEGVTKVFAGDEGSLVALEHLSLDIQEGEFVSLVGPSGCGKSTLLMIAAGLRMPTEGQVRFKGSQVTTPRDEIGVMFQTPTLFPWRTVKNNIALPLQIHKAQNVDWDAAIADAIKLVKLEGFENHYPRELSGGMQQRVALCRLLVSNPRLMLLDEPFGALDEFTREHLNVELSRIAKQEEKTVLFVTHNIGEAVFLSDRVAVMGTNPGRVLDIVDVHLPRPRTLSLRGSSEFGSIETRIRRILGLV